MTSGTVENEARETNYLNVMNLPALMAKRDAAYDRAVQILKSDLFSLSEEKRHYIYEVITQLLSIAIESTTQTMTGKEGRNSETDGILKYLFMLNARVMLAASMASHELTLYEEEISISNFFGSEIVPHLRATDTLYSNFEMEIYHSITEFIERAEPAVKKYRTYIKRSISKNNLNRYVKAFNEYMGLYVAMGAMQDKPEPGEASAVQVAVATSK